MLRKPAVAGLFYPGSKEAIDTQIDRFDAPMTAQPLKAFGVVVPHAGYRYSGGVAAKVYSSIAMEQTAIILGPNHRGNSASVFPPKAAIVTSGVWQFPAGNVAIDERMATLLCEESELIADDSVAHEEEHSLEVQVPFIQHYHGDVSIAPITLAYITPDEIMTLADDIYKAIRRYGQSVTLIASTDFSHYVDQETAESQDRKAIDMILAMDGRGLIDVVKKERISMCGYNAVAVVIEVSLKLGATTATLIDYATSGKVSGDYSSVVGYGGLVIS